MRYTGDCSDDVYSSDFGETHHLDWSGVWTDEVTVAGNVPIHPTLSDMLQAHTKFTAVVLGEMPGHYPMVEGQKFKRCLPCPVVHQRR